MDTKVLKNMSGDGAILTMDFKVADLRKKLDKARFENGKKTNRIEALMAQYDKVGKNMTLSVKHCFIAVLGCSG